MSLLFKHLRTHQVFGANTDVGKTILTSALVRASAAKSKSAFYLKPVSAGPLANSDDQHVKTFAGPHKHLVQTECLFRFEEPVSPHLSAQMAARHGGSVSIPSDETFINSVASYVRRSASSLEGSGHMYIETAGGVHSPTPSGTTQVDCYRPLFLPTILIGDAKLGGISSTVSSYESLVLRGYIVDLIMLFRDKYYRNWEYLQSYFSSRGVTVYTIDAPPALSDNTEDNIVSTESYYQDITRDDRDAGISSAVSYLDDCHTRRLEELDSMAQRTADCIWWPFVQHGLVGGVKDVTVIDSAASDFFSVYNPHSPLESKHSRDSASLLEPQFDGSASWWTQALGHAHPSLTLAAARAAGRYGHVMFPQSAHLPALKLAERLLKKGPGKGWASRVFISDNGSTGMEIALKMALRSFYINNGQSLNTSDKASLGVLGLRGSYHGDTIGAMDACEKGVYTCEWHNAKGFWFEAPTISIQRGRVVISLPSAIVPPSDDTCDHLESHSLSWVYDVEERLNGSLASSYRDHIERTLENLRSKTTCKLAALVLEPLVMGAGGMIFVDPLFQRIMVDVVRGRPADTPSNLTSLPVIFDEVFVGLYRIGMQSAVPILGVNPDISVNAKILTGGLVPLAVTLASSSIFEAFLSTEKSEALLHGHSYTAHPVGCEVANETLEIVEQLTESEPWRDARGVWAKSNIGGESDHIWSFWDPDFVQNLSCIEIVSEVMALGTLLVIKFQDNAAGYTSTSAQNLLRQIKTTHENESLYEAPGAAQFGIHFRTLGNVAYFMTSLNTPSAVVRSVEDRLWSTLHRSPP